MSSRKRPSTTSLPQSPSADESSRFRKYMITMGTRVVCLLLMVLVHPYGWYTWVFAAGAVALPYVAVVIANVGKDAHETTAERPDLALPPAASPPEAPEREASRVIQVPETPRLDAAPPPAKDET